MHCSICLCRLLSHLPSSYIDMKWARQNIRGLPVWIIDFFILRRGGLAMTKDWTSNNLHFLAVVVKGDWFQFCLPHCCLHGKLEFSRNKYSHLIASCSFYSINMSQRELWSSTVVFASFLKMCTDTNLLRFFWDLVWLGYTPAYWQR